ncbi:MAG: DNA/RNA nuclease SfsA [Lentisphaeria bacterium]|nr:DNA/RNA nuclease SfsA [Lentisphaeria bacterium]
MQYDRIQKGVFLSRPNRFIAFVRTEEGKEEKVHVPNTGRCRELLLPGATVFLSEGSNPARKTKYDLVAVEKVLPCAGTLLINMDSHITNAVAEEYLLKNNLFADIFPSLPDVKKEVISGTSRFDFLLEKGEKKLFLEVKSVTLEDNGIVLFPDAPTLRGVKHLEELIRLKKEGFFSAVLFVVQLEKAKEFRPNSQTHPEFAQTLKKAFENGVKILVMTCKVTPESIFLDSPIPFIL